MERKMIRQATLIGMVALSLIFLSCISAQAPAPSVSRPETAAPVQQGWEQEWQRILAAAKQEGTLNIYSPGSSELRQMIVKTIKDRFGLNVEWTALKSAETGTKIMTERRAGLYLADIVAGGAALQQLTELKPAGALDPIKPMLVLPEVLDEKIWYRGRLPWVDNDESYTVNPILAPSARFYINTSMVKPDEFRFYKDLLEPRFEGKFIFANPTLYASSFGEMREIMGLDFLRKLAKTRPVIVDDENLGAQWLAHGKYPIANLNRTDVAKEFIDAGAPIKKVFLGEGVSLAGGAMTAALVNRAPHPNAARVFVNWYISKEAATLFSRFLTMQSARLDVPTDTLSPEQMRDASVKYLNAETENFYVNGPANKTLAAEIFGPLLGR